MFEKLLTVLLALSPASVAVHAQSPALEKRWLRFTANTLVDADTDAKIGYIERAAASGYNGIVVVDGRSANHWILPPNSQAKYLRNHGRLATRARELGLEFIAGTGNFGYGAPILSHDANLATGLPVVDLPLVATGGILVPEATHTLSNGSFETPSSGGNPNSVGDAAFQDAPGTATFLDSTTATDGTTSLRLENFAAAPGRQVRFAKTIPVRPFQPYRIRFDIKAEAFTGDLRFLAGAGTSFDQTLMPQLLSTASTTSEGLPKREFFVRKTDFTTGWIPQTLVVNSLDNTEISILFGVYGGAAGKVWIDNITIDTPAALNVIRRADLPISLTNEDRSLTYAEDSDVSPIRDPSLGQTPYPGNYGTHHQEPIISLSTGSSIADGQRVLLSYFHAQPHFGNAETAPSMTTDATYDIVSESVRRLRDNFEPDALFVTTNEIRVGGWEPSTAFPSSGALFAENIRRSIALSRQQNRGRPVVIWGDMYDPHHNATDSFYLTRGDLTGSWEGVDRDAIVIPWGEGARLTTDMRATLEFWHDRGNRVIAGAYYNQDIEENYAAWQAANTGLDNMIGTIFCTWNGDYSQIENFANTWWGGADGVSSSSISTWRQQHFQTADNSGQAANSADPDKDGIPNLQEYALGTQPLDPADASPILRFPQENGRNQIGIRIQKRPDLIYLPQTSNDLNTWTLPTRTLFFTQSYLSFEPTGTDPGSRTFYRLQIELPE